MAKLFAGNTPFFTALDAAGATISGATLTFQLAGTTTATNVYSDRTLTVSLGSVVAADSAGRFPDIWVQDSISYKVILKDAGGSTIRTVDYVMQSDTDGTATSGGTAELKNQLVNGGFDVWRGGTTFTNVSGANALAEVASGWFFAQPGTASNSITRQTGVSTYARYGLRMQRPAASASVDPLRLLANVPVELVYRVRGSNVALSFSMLSGANFSGGSVQVTLASGNAEGEALTGIAAGTWTGQSAVISATQTPTTTEVRYQWTGQIPATSKEIGLLIGFTGSGTAGANDWVQIENVQLEIIEAGGAATAFAGRLDTLDALEAQGVGNVAFTNTANTYSLTQTFTLAPVFTDQSGTRVALGLGTAATANTGTSGATIPLLNGTATISAAWNFTTAPQVASLELGNASDTTLTRSSAGEVACEGRVLGSKALRVSLKTSGALDADDVEAIVLATAGVTLANAVYSAGQSGVIYNNSGSSITVTQGASLTLRLDGTATTGNRTLPARGRCSWTAITSSEIVIGGGGMT